MFTKCNWVYFWLGDSGAAQCHAILSFPELGHWFVCNLSLVPGLQVSFMTSPVAVIMWYCQSTVGTTPFLLIRLLTCYCWNSVPSQSLVFKMNLLACFLIESLLGSSPTTSLFFQDRDSIWPVPISQVTAYLHRFLSMIFPQIFRALLIS